MNTYDLTIVTDLGVYREAIEADSFSQAWSRAGEARDNWSRVGTVKSMDLIQRDITTTDLAANPEGGEER